MAKPFSFSRNKRLTTAGFKRVLFGHKQPETISNTASLYAKDAFVQCQGLVFLSEEAAPINAQIGVQAPKRLLKRAVLRNRAKRILREAARKHALMAQSTECILSLRVTPALKSRKVGKQLAAQARDVLSRVAAQSAKQRAFPSTTSAKP